MKRELYFVAAALGAAGILMVLMVGVFGADLEPPTFALAVAAAVLIYALRAMFGVVHALARPDVLATLHEQRAGQAAREELRDEQKRVLKAIKELDFDHQMGKLSDPDHAELARTYRLRAVELMRSLDGTATGVHPELAHRLGLSGGRASDEASRPTTEQELDETFVSPPAPVEEVRPGTAVDVPEKIEDMSTGKITESTTEARICGPCGAVNEVDARFCKACGKEIAR